MQNHVNFHFSGLIFPCRYPFMIISCKSVVRLTWDIFLSVIVMTGSFYYPIELAFDNGDGSFWVANIFDKIALLFFGADIILTFRTTYFDKNNEEVVESKAIAKHYVRSISFVIDVLCTLPISEIFELFNLNENLGRKFKVLMLIKMIRLLRINRVLKYIRQDSLKNVYRLAKLLVFFLLTVNLFSKNCHLNILSILVTDSLGHL